jgi:fibronectin-binding autotransporter adhesin
MANGATFTQATRTFLIIYAATSVTLTDVTGQNIKVWNGGGGTNSWILPANWVGGVAPVAGDDLVFAGSVQTTPTNDFAADTSFGSIRFATGASAFTLAAGNRITLTGNFTNSSSNTQTINIAMILNVATCTVDGSSDIILGGIVSEVGGTRALTKTGTNSLIMTAANSYTGLTTVSAGTLGGTDTIAGAVVVSAGGTLAPGTGGTTIGNVNTGAVSFAATGVLSVDLVNATPASEKITATGTFTCTNGTLTVASETGSVPGTVYTIVSATTVSGAFSGKGHGSTFVSAGGRTYQIFYTTTTVTLTDVTGVASSTKTWVGGGGDNNWTTAANWNPSVMPLPGDSLVFAGALRFNHQFRWHHFQ